MSVLQLALDAGIAEWWGEFVDTLLQKPWSISWDSVEQVMPRFRDFDWSLRDSNFAPKTCHHTWVKDSVHREWTFPAWSFLWVVVQFTLLELECHHERMSDYLFVFCASVSWILKIRRVIVYTRTRPTRGRLLVLMNANEKVTNAIAQRYKSSTSSTRCWLIDDSDSLKLPIDQRCRLIHTKNRSRSIVLE